jgi:hypothetical protein
MREQQKLTVKEALEQGYTKCGEELQEWQSLYEVSDFSNPAEFEEHYNRKMVLFSKDAYHPSIDADTIKDLLAEHIACNHADESGDDTENVEDSVRELDFEATAKMINDKLQSVDYWKATDIELIP